MPTPVDINLLIRSVITIADIVKRSQAVKGKDREALDKAAAQLEALNTELEDEIIDLSDIIIRRGNDES